MSLDDFLRECKEEGRTPLRYSEDTLYTNGRRRVRWMDPAYARAMSLLNGVQGDRDKNITSRLYGREVVIRTPQGFHHGELLDYDGKMLYLKGYCFSRKPMDTFKYGSESIFSEDAVVPAKDIISVREIPITVDEEQEAERSSEFRL